VATALPPRSIPTQAATPPKVRAPGASVSFITPAIASIQRPHLPVRVRVHGFALDPASIGKTALPGRGHLQFSLDSGTYDRPRYSTGYALLAAQHGLDGRFSLSGSPSIVYRHLPRGVYVLEVRLANNDESDTGVGAKTTFIVN
jgi:hypothetical protein